MTDCRAIMRSGMLTICSLARMSRRSSITCNEAARHRGRRKRFAWNVCSRHAKAARAAGPRACSNSTEPQAG